MWPSASVFFTLTSLFSTTFVFTALLSTTVAFTTVVFTTVVFTTVASPTVCRRSLVSAVQFTARPLASVVDLTGGTLADVFQAAGLRLVAWGGAAGQSGLHTSRPSRTGLKVETAVLIVGLVGETAILNTKYAKTTLHWSPSSSIAGIQYKINAS